MIEPDAQGTSLLLHGRWTLASLWDIDAALRAAHVPAAHLTIDGAGLEAVDTAGALALVQGLALRGADIGRTVNLQAHHAHIIDAVRGQNEAPAGVALPARYWVGRLGFAGAQLARLVRSDLDFAGRCMAAIAELAVHPGRARWKEFAAQLEHICIEALPVVALVAFLIGTVLAYLFGLQAEKYGASIFVVDAVAIGSARELAPILVAVIVAGRSGAAFTAQLGSMRLTEEIDALRTLALSPMQVLVVPRLLALVVSLPLLVFVGDLAAIGGAMAASAPLLDIPPQLFIERVHSQLALQHVAVGLGKAVVFGAAIAVIGCRAGMNVERDARSIGVATTSTVVRCIVAVILLDALFAVWLQSVGL